MCNMHEIIERCIKEGMEVPRGLVCSCHIIQAKKERNKMKEAIKTTLIFIFVTIVLLAMYNNS